MNQCCFDSVVFEGPAAALQMQIISYYKPYFMPLNSAADLLASSEPCFTAMQLFWSVKE